jgi:hypothetical protein
MKRISVARLAAKRIKSIDAVCPIQRRDPSPIGLRRSVPLKPKGGPP